jgi:hypothetical protein
MPAVSVGGKDAGLQGRTAIVDTGVYLLPFIFLSRILAMLTGVHGSIGTTLIIAPQADAVAVHALIPGAQSDGQGGFTIPCNTQTQVALTFGNTVSSIDPRDLAFAPLSNDPNGDCASGITSGNVGGPTEWLVGDVFLKVCNLVESRMY